MKGWLSTLIVCMCGCLSIGCSSEGAHPYGAANYPERNTSINGLGVFMGLCKDAGIRTIEVRQLSPRLDKFDVLLLIGDTLTPPASEARDWIEDWLGEKPGRSVVYVGRDFDSDIYYRQATLAKLPSDQQERARIELANAQADVDTLITHEIPRDTFCRWFVIRPRQPSRQIDQFVGPWADKLKSLRSPWPIRVQLAPPSAAEAADLTQRPLLKSSTTPSGSEDSAPQTPSAAESDDAPLTSSESAASNRITRAIWSASEIDDEETWRSEWEKTPDTESLLAGQDGTPLVMSLRSERYPNSQIIALVNAAPLLNGSLVEPLFRQVAHQLIEQLLPAKRLAILHFDSSGISISDTAAEGQVEGIAILTTWPLNIIFAHLVFAGGLALLAVFPIFGRPQESKKLSVSDFGQHAEAMGQMLARTGDAQFALKSISQYFAQVGHEQPPSWVQSALRAAEQPGSSLTPAASTSSDLPTISGPSA